MMIFPSGLAPDSTLVVTVLLSLVWLQKRVLRCSFGNVGSKKSNVHGHCRVMAP
uniref:Uncharacterized protein n=1 Tax=Anguilla anguilla TaxID=7936 RepID=A0A0E9SHZ9_ANGAN